MKNTFLLAVGAVASFIILLVLIKQFSNPAIVHQEDYLPYLNTVHFQKINENLQNQIKFWEDKLSDAPDNFVYQKKLAGLYAKDFRQSGDIQQLQKSDALFLSINEQIPHQVSVLQALSSNAITRHDFQAAECFAQEAVEIGERKFASTLLAVDAMLENGELWLAKHYMNDLATPNHFDYLIRMVKILDQSGDLMAAIETMEKALNLAKAINNKDLINWSLANLADMYGHDGRIQKSYETYLQALSYNPADFHALKGIAWVAFSNDKNSQQAKEILSFLQSVHPVPDYDLLLAEIAHFENQTEVAKIHEVAFMAKANKPEYENMYKSYLFFLESDKGKALRMARAEIENRPHPLSYNLLAWANFQIGNTSAAIDILEQHVMEQTEEPDALLYTGIILKESGQKKKAKKYLNAAREAAYELGPAAAKEIAAHLNTL